jgi:hypothetical protein
MDIEKRVEQYRQRAAEARREANRTYDEIVKKRFMDLAQGWEEMAQRVLKDNGPSR